MSKRGADTCVCRAGALAGAWRLESGRPSAETSLVSARHTYAAAFAVAAAYLAIGIAGYLFLLGRIEPPPLAPDAA